MSEINFIYWLQGFLELSDSKEITKEQVEVIKEHISLVLEKKTTTTKDAVDRLLGPHGRRYC